jgi:hypothetical protein
MGLWTCGSHGLTVKNTLISDVICYLFTDVQRNALLQITGRIRCRQHLPDYTVSHLRRRSPSYCYDHQIKENETGGAYCINGAKEKFMQNFRRKS